MSMKKIEVGQEPSVIQTECIMLFAQTGLDGTALLTPKSYLKLPKMIP